MLYKRFTKLYSEHILFMNKIILRFSEEKEKNFKAIESHHEIFKKFQFICKIAI